MLAFSMLTAVSSTTFLVYRVNPQHYFLCVNASNQEKDYEHIAAQNRWECEVDFASERYSQLAIQGPRAAITLQKLTGTDLSTIRYYRFRDGEVDGVPARLARTGYTGEDCFEVFFDPAESEHLWKKVLEAGSGVRNQALRPGRAQHAAPGSRHGSLRP
jgi:aminomethyltransferase